MPKNYLVEEMRPKSFGAFNTKSKNMLILDIKPRMGIMDMESNQPAVVTRTLYAGMPIGLLLTLTYPTDIPIT